MEPVRRQTTAYPEPPPAVTAQEGAAASAAGLDLGKSWQPEMGKDHQQTTAYPVPPPRYDE